MLGVVIVNYGSSEDLSGAVLDLSCSRVVVVDNFSSIEETDRIQLLAEHREWELISLSENVGFGSAAALGADRAIALGCENLLFLNPDAEIGQPSLDLLQESLASNPRRMVSPVVYRPDGSLWFGGGLFDLRVGRPEHADAVISSPVWLTGACLMMTKGVWLESGGFASSYFLYWEDVELTFRWSRAGELHIVKEAYATHVVGGTQKSKNLKSPIYVMYNVRNRRLFAKRNVSAYRRALWALLTPLYIRSLLRTSGGRSLWRQRRLLSDFLRPALSGIIARLPS